jgi:hypothetical protein
MATYPTLHERVESCLLAAGFNAYEDTLPHKDSGGTFDLIAGAGVLVEVAWWDVGYWDRRALLEQFAAALRSAGLVVEDRGEALYVAEAE